MRVIFAGTPEAAVPSLRALHQSNHEIVAVLTRPAAPKGRGRHFEPSVIAKAAENLNLPVLTPSTIRDGELIQHFENLKPQCCAVVAYGHLVPPSLLELPQHGWVNLHFSLLPAWRGAAPVQHAILHGDDITGATTFALDTGLDTGATYGHVTEPITETDTAGQLLQRLANSGATLLSQTLDGISDGSITAVDQPTEGVSYAPKLSVHDARIDWGLSALHINRLVRACAPSPGAWTTLRDSRVKVMASTVLSEETIEAGRLVADKDSVIVGCGISAVRLNQVQPEGKRAMTGTDWARGLRLTAGEMFR